MPDIEGLIGGGKIGTFDVACPMCGPSRRSPVNQRRKTLRIYRHEPEFVGYHCARCGERGYCRDGATAPLDRAKLERARAETAEREHAAALEQLRKARWLWSISIPIQGTIGERYIRSCRGYGGTLPSTLRFLPARGQHGPAMLGAFGLPAEPEPGQLAIAGVDVVGVHITRLADDGSSKAGTETEKIMIGRSAGFPIVLAPPNDVLGLVIAEGIEDALSAHQATGLGAWAAGCADRLPGMADAVPDFIETVTVLVDADPKGEEKSTELAQLLIARGIEVPMVRPGAVA